MLHQSVDDSIEFQSTKLDNFGDAVNHKAHYDPNFENLETEEYVSESITKDSPVIK